MIKDSFKYQLGYNPLLLTYGMFSGSVCPRLHECISVYLKVDLGNSRGQAKRVCI